VIGVREAVRPRLRGADDGALGERQHRARRPGRGKHLRDRLASLRVRDGVTGSLLHPQLDVLRGGDRGDELGAAALSGPELEMRP
jgi:hypothetical protein